MRFITHIFLMFNVLCMLWIDVMKRGFDTPTVSLAAALVGLHVAHSVFVDNDK